METKEALHQRKSCRAFLENPVAQKTIEQILSLAALSPSGANTQPWQVAVVSGKTKQALQQQMEKHFRNGVRGQADYRYYPKKWIQPYDNRRKDCGSQLYNVLDISRSDKVRRIDQWAANYRAFDAPVMLFFFLDGTLEAGSYLDYGMYLQSLMLAAIDNGLATCPQAALAEYPELVKKALGYPQDSTLLCGMALGYEDIDAPVNSYRTPRTASSAYTRYFD